MKFRRKLAKKLLKLDKKPIIILIIFLIEFSFPQYSIAAGPSYIADIAEKQVIEEIKSNDWLRCEAKESVCEFREFLPQAEDIKPKKTVYIAVTAYSSTPDQTDDTPCITASGFDVCEHNQENIIAANFLLFGARVRFPDYFGDRVFIVEDRMNARYPYRMDVWMRTREKAKLFGIRRLRMEIL